MADAGFAEPPATAMILPQAAPPAATDREDAVKSDRGFASMNPDKQREIASKGGKAAHAKGTAYEWSREQAREAGRKGAAAHAQRRKNDAERAVANSPD